jgi:Zn-dependent protease
VVQSAHCAIRSQETLLLFNYTPATLIARIVVLLIAMTVHEFAHVYVAYLAGDTTGVDQGRLTLNPFVHIHWVGFAMFVLLGFGILGSAPVNANRMRNPRWGHLAAVSAGPLSNLLLAFLMAMSVRIGRLPVTFPVTQPYLPTLAEFLGEFIFWNVLLFVFNILPFFPIDGWNIVRGLLPVPARYTWERHAQTSQYILLGLILLAFAAPRLNILGLLIGLPTQIILRLLVG